MQPAPTPTQQTLIERTGNSLAHLVQPLSEADLVWIRRLAETCKDRPYEVHGPEAGAAISRLLFEITRLKIEAEVL